MVSQNLHKKYDVIMTLIWPDRGCLPRGLTTLQRDCFYWGKQSFACFTRDTTFALPIQTGAAHAARVWGLPLLLAIPLAAPLVGGGMLVSTSTLCSPRSQSFVAREVFGKWDWLAVLQRAWNSRQHMQSCSCLHASCSCLHAREDLLR